MNRAQDPHMGAAATQIGLHLGADLRVGRLRIALQQRLRPHHHAGDAVAALRGLLFHESALDRRRRLDGAEALQRRDLLAFEQQQRRHAGQYRLAVDDHGAGAALAEAATEFRGVEFQVVAEHVEQRRIRIGVDLMILTIDLQCHHGFSRCVALAGALLGPGEVCRNTVWVCLASATVFTTSFHGGWLLKRARRNFKSAVTWTSFMLSAKPGMIGLRSPATARTPDRTMLAALRASGP